MPKEVKSDNTYIQIIAFKKNRWRLFIYPLLICLSVTLVICLQPDSLWMGRPFLTFRLPPSQRKTKLTRTFHCDLMLQASGTQADNDTSASSLPPVLQQHHVVSSHQRNDSYVNFVECCFWASTAPILYDGKTHTAIGKPRKATPEREINSILSPCFLKDIKREIH